MKKPPYCVSVQPEALRQRGFESFNQWNNNPNHLYIGRNATHKIGCGSAFRSKWANEFPVKKHGRRNCIIMYENKLRTNKKLMDSIHELEGKELGCY